MTPEDAHAIWKSRYERWLGYLFRLSECVEAGREIPVGPSPAKPRRPNERPAHGTSVVYCAPHPDDEAISGALALRLRQDSGARITDVAVTLGSDKAERPRRMRELESACSALGFDLVVPRRPSSFDHVNLAARSEQPEEWQAKVLELAEIFHRLAPEAVFLPHAHDFNTTHVGTHALVVDAIGTWLEASGHGPVLLFETEIWGPIERPNLMVGLSIEFVAAQLVGISEHGGEVKRNPYHLLHPFRLMDNVRRGSEVVGGQGSPAVPFKFAELYHAVWMKGAERVPARPGGSILRPDEKIDLDLLRARFPLA